MLTYGFLGIKGDIKACRKITAEIKLKIKEAFDKQLLMILYE